MRSVRYVSYSLLLALLLHALLLFLLFLTILVNKELLTNHLAQHAQVYFDQKHTTSSSSTRTLQTAQPVKSSAHIASDDSETNQTEQFQTTAELTQSARPNSASNVLEQRHIPAGKLEDTTEKNIESNEYIEQPTITDNQELPNITDIPDIPASSADQTTQDHYQYRGKQPIQPRDQQIIEPTEQRKQRIAAIRKAGIFNQIRQAAQQDFIRNQQQHIPTEEEQSATIAGSRTQNIPDKYRHVQERISYWSDAHYQQKVCRAILNAARLYPKYLHSPQDVKKEIIVHLPIYPDGTLGSIDQSELTGVTAIDTALLGILKITRFPPLPAHIKRKVKVYYKAIRIRIEMRAGSNYFQVTAL